MSDNIVNSGHYSEHSNYDSYTRSKKSASRKWAIRFTEELHRLKAKGWVGYLLEAGLITEKEGADMSEHNLSLDDIRTLRGVKEFERIASIEQVKEIREMKANIRKLERKALSKQSREFRDRKRQLMLERLEKEK